MHYYVARAVDGATGRGYVLGLARADDAGTVECYDVEVSSWVDAPQALREDIGRGDGWAPVMSQEELNTAFRQLPDDSHRWLNTPVQPGFWVSVAHNPDEPQALFRSTDGRSLEGYAVTSGRWELMSYPATIELNDRENWIPIAPEDVADTQAWLHARWDLQELRAFDAQAPELVNLELTEAGVRKAIVQYVIEILRSMPDGLVVGYQEKPGGATGGTSSGPVGPGGSWNLQTTYGVWGFPKKHGSDTVFDAFRRLFAAWGWTYRDDEDPTERNLSGWTNTNRKDAFHVNITRYSHGGMSMTWTSPFFPAKHAFTKKAGVKMPSVITKDGIQSWVPPVYSVQTKEHNDESDDGGFDGIVRRYNSWRRIAASTGAEHADEPDWESGRLYFRSDYLAKARDEPQWREHGDWGAWIVDPTSDGEYCVLRSLVPERSNNRQETVAVVFSRLADAGKYIIAQLGDSIRSRLGLPTLAVHWDDSGLDSRIDAAPADPGTIDNLVRADPSTNRQAAEQHLTIYRVRDDPSAYAIAFPGDPYIRVLATSFAELRRALLDGMPESITAHIAS